MRALLLGTIRSSPSSALSQCCPSVHVRTVRRRHLSTSIARPVLWKRTFYNTIFVLGSGLFYLYVTDVRASVHSWFVVPLVQTLWPDAEAAHNVGNVSLKMLWHFGLHPRERTSQIGDKNLHVDLFGYDLVNPIAISAGLDKAADIPDALFALGPSVVEIGGVTPLSQPGNAKPRVFRIPSQNAIINRYGLNSHGADRMADILQHRVRRFAASQGLGSDFASEQYVLDGHAGVPPGSLTSGRLMAINIAKNKDTPDSDLERVKQDYASCVKKLGPYADILVINVSSPNTPGLRSLQQSTPLTEILAAVAEAARKVPRSRRPALMVKVSPDEDSDAQIKAIAGAVWETGADGIIVANTTRKRPDPSPPGYSLAPVEQAAITEDGGYSGQQLFGQTLSLIMKYRAALDRPSGRNRNARTDFIDRLGSKAVPSIAELHPAENLESHEGPLEHERQQDNVDHASHPASSIPLLRYPANNNGHEKVIFASGGIANGKQALEALNAGASIAMLYTALVYGGAGTVARIKDEMSTGTNKGKKAACDQDSEIC